METFNINIIKIELKLEISFKKAAKIKRLITSKKCTIIANPLIDDINFLILKINSFHQVNLRPSKECILLIIKEKEAIRYSYESFVN